MNSVTLNYDLNNSFNNITMQVKPVILKGATTLNISLTGILENDFRVDQVVIDWGDNTKQEVYKREIFFNYRTQSIFNEILYGKLNGSVLGVYSHDYINEYSTYETDYVISIIIQKNNGKFIYIKQPVRSFWGSFYDSLERLTILNTQILPLTSNNSFVNFEGVDGTTFAANLANTGVALVSGGVQDVTPIDVFGYLDLGFLAATDQNDRFTVKDIEITLSDNTTYTVDCVLGYSQFNP
jgi:hypothetical protein